MCVMAVQLSALNFPTNTKFRSSIQRNIHRFIPRSCSQFAATSLETRRGQSSPPDGKFCPADSLQTNSVLISFHLFFFYLSAHVLHPRQGQLPQVPVLYPRAHQRHRDVSGRDYTKQQHIIPRSLHLQSEQNQQTP